MFQTGQQIGFYKLIEKIGKGGFGEVWLAEKRSEFVTKRVAVKLPHAGLVDFDEIRQEATLWEQVSGHPNVLPLIDADVFDGQVAIVSEYAEGGSLADRLEAQGKFTVREAVEMIVGILNGLEFLHSKKIIHRDIKPANILLQNETPRLADFGISRAVETNTFSSVVVGTENYMAPEAFDGARNIQTDIWSVGVVLYQLLKGSLPFPQKQASEVMYAVLLKQPEPLPPEIPHELQEIVFKALEKDKDLNGKPPRRYQTVSAMRDDLRNFLENFSEPVLTTTEFAPILTNPQTEVATRVKLKIPVLSEGGWRDIKESLLTGKLSPFVVFAVILGGAAILWLAVSLFSSSSSGTDANVSGTNANISDAAFANESPATPAPAVSVTPENFVAARQHGERGYKLFTQKKYNQAIEAYTKGIELNPLDEQLYNDRGLIYYGKRDFDRAIADFNKALELNPNDSVAYNNRGVAYEDKGEREKAIADYQKALELDPNNERAIRNLEKILK